MSHKSGTPNQVCDRRVPCSPDYQNATCFWWQATHQGRIRGATGDRRGVAGERPRERDAPPRVRVRSALRRNGSGLDWIDRCSIGIMRRSTDSLGTPASLLIASVIVATIIIPKKKTSIPNLKEKRKAGTRAGLTKAAIVAAGAELIESVGASEFSLRRLAKELGVGPTTIHFHFEGGIRAVSSAVTQQALAGVTRPY